MNSKYANIMLTIIAACLVFQVGHVLWELERNGAMPVVVQGFNVGDEKLPVSIKESADIDVTITGVSIPTGRTLRRLSPMRDTLPVSIDGFRGKALSVLDGIPVEIQR